jgi:hypothetical protein
MTTKPKKRPGSALLHGCPKHQCCSKSRVVYVLLTIRSKVFALLFPDQIKPIEQLVPVS